MVQLCSTYLNVETFRSWSLKRLTAVVFLSHHNGKFSDFKRSQVHSSDLSRANITTNSVDSELVFYATINIYFRK